MNSTQTCHSQRENFLTHNYCVALVMAVETQCVQVCLLTFLSCSCLGQDGRLCSTTFPVSSCMARKEETWKVTLSLAGNHPSFCLMKCFIPFSQMGIILNYFCYSTNICLFFSCPSSYVCMTTILMCWRLILRFHTN